MQNGNQISARDLVDQIKEKIVYYMENPSMDMQPLEEKIASLCSMQFLSDEEKSFVESIIPELLGDIKKLEKVVRSINFEPNISKRGQSIYGKSSNNDDDTGEY